MSRYEQKIHEEMYKGFRIVFSVEPEFLSIRESFPDFEEEEIEKMITDVDNYDAVWFIAIVTAYLPMNETIKYNGGIGQPYGYEKIINDVELASDTLGGCYYETYEEFYTKYHDDYYKQMVETVVDESLEIMKRIGAKLFELQMQECHNEVIDNEGTV